MVNASVHFDTVSIYALTVCDAADVLRLSQAVDDRDVYGREAPIEVTIRKAQNLRIAIPSAKDLEFFVDMVGFSPMDAIRADCAAWASS